MTTKLSAKAVSNRTGIKRKRGAVPAIAKAQDPANPLYENQTLGAIVQAPVRPDSAPSRFDMTDQHTNPKQPLPVSQASKREWLLWASLILIVGSGIGVHLGIWLFEQHQL